MSLDSLSMRKRQSVRVPILVYHWFEEPGRGKPAPARRFEISEKLFEQHLQTFRRRGYRSVNLHAVRAAVTGEAGLPKKALVITFDDGTEDFRLRAFPLLQKYGYCAIRKPVSLRVSAYPGKRSGISPATASNSGPIPIRIRT
jgi:hypothetical protein